MIACLDRAGVKASHSSARILWGAAIDRFEDPVEVTAPRSSSTRMAPGVIVHRSTRRDEKMWVRSSIPVTSPERTVLDLAARLTEEELAGLVGQLVALRHVTVPRLTRALGNTGGQGVGGSNRLRRLLAGFGDGPAWESLIEAELLRILIRTRLPRPSLQHVIRRSGKPVARVDFAWPSARVALEVDGYRWHAGLRAYREDRSRGNRIVEAGWMLLRTTPAEIRGDPESLCRTLEQVLRATTAGRPRSIGRGA
jgi:very-short-patch-repair endonuclease